MALIPAYFLLLPGLVAYSRKSVIINKKAGDSFKIM